MIGLLLFIWPFAEIYAWYHFIQAYSFLDAVALVLTGGLVGLTVMMIQGKASLQQIQMSVSLGKPPEKAVLHRGLIMFGGLLIFLPGFISKWIGLLFIVPGTRHLILFFLFEKLKFSLVKNGTFFAFKAGGQAWTSHANSRAERDVIEVEPTKIEHRRIDPAE